MMSCQPPGIFPYQCAKAVIAVLTTSDNRSRKPVARMRPNASSRLRKSCHTPRALFCIGTRQMRSSAVCSSAKIVVAPTTRTATLTTPASIPVRGLLALLTSACTAAAPWSPITSRSCMTSSPCTAACPKKNPATAITMTSNGAIENTV